MQSIIVYSNPMEAAFWEMMSNGDIIPIIIAVLVFLAVFIFIHYLIEKSQKARSYMRCSNIPMMATFVISSMLAFIAGKYFWLS